MGNGSVGLAHDGPSSCYSTALLPLRHTLMTINEKEPWLVEDSVLKMVESKDGKKADSSDEKWVALSEDWMVVMKVGWTV
jgi:hypothetical protein